MPRAGHFGDLITADHKVLSEGCESRNNHRCAVVVQDLATQWIQAYPCKTKTSQETQRSLHKFLEPNRKPKVIYNDNSLGRGTSCEDLSWNHCTSTPHRSETNGIAERAVRRIKERTSAVLLQSGLDEKWWADSMECYCYLRNVQDLLADGKTRRYRKVSRELVSTQYWNRFLIAPLLCKKLSHVRIDQCEEDTVLDRDIDARSSNFTAPSSSRFAESSCRSNLIINFDTSRQFWSNVAGSTSIHFRSWYRIDTEDNVEFDVCCGLAFATGFPVLLSPILST